MCAEFLYVFLFINIKQVKYENGENAFYETREKTIIGGDDHHCCNGHRFLCPGSNG
jgi:hypothetical protein